MIPDHELLEIVLVAHGGIGWLHDTLKRISDSPLRNMLVRVVVCDAEFSFHRDGLPGQLPAVRLNCIGHAIGKEAACLHAVELVEARYGWIICDDTEADFRSAADLIPELERGAADALYVGHPDIPSAARGQSFDMEGVTAGAAGIYAALSPWPLLIFRTAWYDEECLVKGYRLVNNRSPHFAFINALIERNGRLYIAHRPAAACRESGSEPGDGLYRFSSWLNCCQNIKNVRLRKREISRAAYGSEAFSHLSVWVAEADERFTIRFWSAMIDILIGLEGKQRREFLLVWILAAAPLPPSLRGKLLAAAARQSRRQGSSRD